MGLAMELEAFAYRYHGVLCVLASVESQLSAWQDSLEVIVSSLSVP